MVCVGAFGDDGRVPYDMDDETGLIAPAPCDDVPPVMMVCPPIVVVVTVPDGVCTVPPVN